MIQELSRFAYLRTYKKVRVTFLKDEDNNYIENLQMLVFLGDYEKPVFATKLNTFEFYEATVYNSERVWMNVPFIVNTTSSKVTKIRLNDSELKRFDKFSSKFNIKTINLIRGEVFSHIKSVDASDFSKKPVKKKRERVQITYS